MNSTAQPTKMLRILNAIQERDEIGNSRIKGRYFRLKEDAENHSHNEVLTMIPKGTIICADFGGDLGLYATADVDGILYQIKIDLQEIHKIDFGDLE